MRISVLALLFAVGILTVLGPQSVWALDPPAALAPAAPPRATIDEVDAIVRRAPDLNALLANQPLLEEYYTALQSYYGGSERFPRQSFDAILGQLRTVNERVPGFGARLWETTNLGSTFTINATARTSGRDLNSENLNSYMTQWRSSLAAVQSESFRALSDEQKVGRARALFSRTQDRIQEFERGLQDLSRSARARRTPELQAFYRSLAQDPEFRSVSAWLVERRLASEYVQDHLRTGDPDLVLDTLHTLRQNPAQLFEGVLQPGERFPSQLTPAIQERVPARSTLLENTDVFPVRMIRTNRGAMIPAGRTQTSVYEFRAIPRRLHGVWSGVPLGECVGGRCAIDPGTGRNFLESLTPERWAVVALQDTQVQHVLENGEYRGFVQVVPLERPGVNGARSTIVGSTEFGSPALRNQILIESREGRLTRVPLYDLWLREANRRRPRSWRGGLVVSGHNAINNAGVLGDVRTSAAYLMGRSAGRSRDLRHLDPMAEGMIGAIPRSGFARGYGGRMVVDAMVPQAIELIRVLPIPQSALSNPQVVRSWLQCRTCTQDERLRRVRSLIETKNVIIQRELAELLTDSNPDIRLWAMRALRWVQDVSIQRRLAGYLTDSNVSIRAEAVFALSGTQDVSIQLQVAARLDDSNLHVQTFAVRALSRVQNVSIQRRLAKRLADSNPEIRLAAASALRGVQNVSIQRQLAKLLRDSNTDVRRNAVQALSGTQDIAIQLKLVGLLIDDPDLEVSIAASNSLKAARDERVLAEIRRLSLENPNTQYVIELLSHIDSAIAAEAGGAPCSASVMKRVVGELREQ